jgi:Poly(ADP-ribose) polymerase catalytic domain
MDEVVNDDLKDRYESKKAHLMRLRDGNIKEKQLFHGTKYEYIDNIAKHGFDIQFNKTAAFGKGTYFATNASYSREFTNQDRGDVSYMFLCDVLIGNCWQFHNSQEIDTNKYDNGVDRLDNPTIYVCPYNDGCYPKYLIAFHKNAAK